MAEARQQALEGAEYEQDVGFGARLAHQSDAPDLALQRTQPAADLELKLVQQGLAYAGVIDAVGDAHRVERPQPVALLRGQPNPERRESGRERMMMALVARPARFQPLL